MHNPALLLFCIGVAHGFSVSPTLRPPLSHGVAYSPLGLRGTGGVRGGSRAAAALRMQEEGGGDDKKDDILKKLGGIDMERASPPKEEKTMEGPFPDWAYVVFPILGAATAFLLQYVGKAPQL
uniref:Photosystem I reaction center subunit VIII n=1 Tax=Hemiselmis andersenii TaxID=464988 RepID=A0A6U4VB03_HEMAN|mmetsp:Transcript_41252/g.96391  ORF Transcript_41252/g.96391 Transcript_41252/m.96391 type:complete len:123 (+) Transcript_41252:79-447(+)